MKKFMMIAAMAAVALTSCVKNEVIDNDQVEVNFQAVNKVAQKAIITGATFDTANKFDVYGFFSNDSFATSSEFMTGVEISNVSGTWKNAARPYYWPLSGQIRFYAVYPETLAPTSVTCAAGVTFTAYTISNANKDVDFMYAENTGAKGSSPLAMVFNHALSQVVVAIKTDADYSANATFTVNSVTFNNIALTGAFVQKPAAWTPAAQSDNFVYSNVAATATSTLATYGAALLMIPQAMVTTGNKTALTINYTLAQDGKEVTSNVAVDLSTAWVAGHKYTFNLNFKLDEITFNPSVTLWVDEAAEGFTIE